MALPYDQSTVYFYSNYKSSGFDWTRSRSIEDGHCVWPAFEPNYSREFAELR